VKETWVKGKNGQYLVADAAVEYLGIHNPDDGTFQGAGTSGTEFDEVFVGIGDTPAEALDDALESAACAGWSIEDRLEQTLAAHLPAVDASELHFEDCPTRCEHCSCMDGHSYCCYCGQEMDGVEECDCEGSFQCYVAVYLRAVTRGAYLQRPLAA